MHRITPSPILVLLFVFSFFFCSVDSTASFSNCNQTFNCGSLRNISYPFTGGDRPSYCGPPEFRLSCVDNSTQLTVDSLSYRVLELDPVFQTLSLARLDLWNETCPKDFLNTTIDNGVFSYGAGNSDLTMFYKCNASVLSMKPVNQFHCDTNGSSNDSYFLVGPIPFDPILNIIQCNESIRVPILEETSLDLTNNRSLLGEALMLGFNVSYSIPDADQCSKCLDSGEQCGFDSNSNESICICGDQRCSVSGRSSSKLGRIIAIAGAVSGVIIFCTIILCYYKRECMLSIIARVFQKDTSKEFDVEAFIRNYESISTKRYSYARVKKMTNSFTEKIGSGGFGAVYKGKLPDGHPVAVKILKNSKGDGEEFINEVASIGRTSHVNIVTLLGYCYERNKRALIYEYMPNGSLDKFIFKQGSNVDANCSLEWETLYRIAVGIARGLQYLHQGCNTRILHFDIKPQNILLDDDFCPKISDFGLAKLWLKKESIMSMVGARGTFGYIAPEVFSRNFGGVSHKSDVYSYGMLALEMVGGRKNFDSTVSRTSEIYYPNRIYKDLELGNEASILGVTAEEEKEIIRKMVLVSFWCIQTNPSDRPSMSKVLEMLEGSLESLEIPPKPYLFSPTRSP